MRRITSVVLAGAMVALAACADPSTSEPAASGSTSAMPSTAAAFPATAGGVTLEAQPDSIVSLSSTATENLFAIGAGEQVSAVDEYSDYPPEAPTTKLSGFDANVEAIVTYDPDLVVIAFDPGGLQKGLEKVGVPVLMQGAAATLDDTYAQIADLGTLTGHADQAEALVTQMQADIDAAIADAPDGAGMSVYHELDDTYYSLTSDTFAGLVYEAFGMTNIADEAKGAGSGYPQLSAEYIIESNPDLIVLADGVCCGQSLETVAERDGWDTIAAVRDGDVVVIDDAIASRWGPRIVDFIEDVSVAVQEAAA